MNIFNRITLLSCIVFSRLFLNIDANLSSDGNYIECNAYDNMKLCIDTINCPNDYHICNPFDIETLVLNRMYFTEIDRPYYTNIGSLNDKCGICNDNKYFNALVIQPELSSEYKHGCFIGNKLVPYGYSVKINECNSCSCGGSENDIKCYNHCEYGYNLDIYNTLNYDYITNDCVGLKQDRSDYLCSDIRNITIWT